MDEAAVMKPYLRDEAVEQMNRDVIEALGQSSYCKTWSQGHWEVYFLTLTALRLAPQGIMSLHF